MTALERLQRFLGAEVARAERDLELALDELARAQALATISYADAHAPQLAVARLVSRVRALGDLSGRISVRWPRAKAPVPETFELVGSWQDVQSVEREYGTRFLDGVPPVVFDAAVDDLARRDPYGATFLRDMGLAVADMYGPVVMGPLASGEPTVFPHGFAAAQAATEESARRVHAALVEGLSRGVATEDVARGIADALGWSAGYARNVVRTNYNTAATAGRFVEAKAVNDAGIPTGFRYSCVTDSDVRRGRPQDHGENHLALNGLKARVDDPIWDRFSPPGGWQCRCLLEVLIGDDVPRDFVRVPPGASFAPGFGTRGDRATYG